MRFTFTSILDLDDDRMEKYYSPEQKEIISHMKNLKHITLDLQIQNAIDYIINSQNNDSMNAK